MGISDILSQFYYSHNGTSKLRRPRSRFFQKWSDMQPLDQHTSTSSSYPEEQDLKIAGSLLNPNPTSIQDPSNPNPNDSNTHTSQNLQTLVPTVPGPGCNDCTQIVSETSLQPGIVRYYSLPKISPETYSGQGASVTQSDPLPRGSSRSARRSRRFLSISRVFNSKRSRNLRIPSTISGDTKPSGQSSLPQSSVQDTDLVLGGENQTPRKVSDQTIISEQSTHTVCHHPSKRYDDDVVPLETADHQGDYNPFTEQARSRDQSSDSNPFRSNGKSSDETDVFLSSESAPYDEHYVERPVRKSPRPSSLRPPPRNQSRSWDSLSYRIFSDTSVAMRNFDQSKAAYDFNFFALKLNLVPLRLDRSGRPITGSSFSLVPVKARTPAGSLLRRLRSFKSTITLKQNSGARALRRMKTIANISSQYQIGSLKGKPLEALARLGGHSFLNLPPSFAPITLKLPVCIAATAHYIALHGRKMPHIFLDCGDDRVVRKLYDHFAEQVLSAELSKDKIDSTTRGSFLPSDTLSADSAYTPNTSTYIHNVATVFKRFLAGLPGGVLGSVELYGTLKRIHDQDFNDEQLNMDPAFGDYTLNGKSASSAVKVKMVALALLALTTDMQLELICAVFGLTSLIAHETERQVAQPHGRMHGDGSTCSGCQGFSNSKTLGEIFGPLLLSGPGGTNPSEVNSLAEKNVDIGAAGVAKMLIEIWRDVCVQFQCWRVFCPVSGG
ncbi:hypothetical protein FQN54_006908 [Arachnomyces sp. PD_36]|nr:hypothetical protein FQN54_006908 [Arachnomyces sp. PD_36]